MFDKVFVALTAMAIGVALHSDSRRAGSHPPVWSRKTCGQACTVRNNAGGYIDEFLVQAKHVVRDRITLKIDGTCDSACTMAADRARPYACVTKRAVMRFHQYYGETALGVKYRGDPSEYYRVDIVRWVKEHGGFPGFTQDDDDLLVMKFEDATQFWPVCV